MRIAIAALAVLALAGAASAATTRKVPQDYDTIQQAVDAADEGDTILVSKRPDGKPWDERVATGKSLKFVGKKVVWDGHDAEGGYGTCLYVDNEILPEGVVVQGFVFRNGQQHVFVRGNGTLVQSCTFKAAYGTAVRLEGDGNRVLKCVFRGNNRAGEIAGDGALYDRNSVFGSGSGGLYALGSAAVLSRNRTVNAGGGPALYAEGNLGRITGNTSTGGSVGAEIYGDAGAIEGNRVSGTGTTQAGILVYGRANAVSGNTVGRCGLHGIQVDGGEGSAPGPNIVEGNSVRWAGSIGIYVRDWQAEVRGNAVALTAAAGIEVVHEVDASASGVAENAVSDAFGEGIHVLGGGFEVTGNQVRSTRSYGIYANGIGYAFANRVAGNRVSGTSDTGIYLDADGASFQVEDNEVTAGSGSGEGIHVSSNGGTAGTVLRNRVSGVPGSGIRVLAGAGAAGTQVSDNEVSSCGRQYDSGIYFGGSGAVLSGNTVADVQDVGMYVNASNTQVDGNDVQRCDGAALIVFGSGNAVTGNAARTGDGEGFSNFGTSTIFSDNVFLGFRLDVTNDGTFTTPDIDAVNSFETGGASTAAQYWIP